MTLSYPKTLNLLVLESLPLSGILFFFFLGAFSTIFLGVGKLNFHLLDQHLCYVLRFNRLPIVSLSGKIMIRRNNSIRDCYYLLSGVNYLIIFPKCLNATFWTLQFGEKFGERNSTPYIWGALFSHIWGTFKYMYVGKRIRENKEILKKKKMKKLK